MDYEQALYALIDGACVYSPAEQAEKGADRPYKNVWIIRAGELLAVDLDENGIVADIYCMVKDLDPEEKSPEEIESAVREFFERNNFDKYNDWKELNPAPRMPWEDDFFRDRR